MSSEDVSALRRIAERLDIRPPDVGEWFVRARLRCVTVTFCNPLSVRVARDPVFLADLATIDHVYADGILLARCASRLRGAAVPRVAFDGNSLAPAVFAAAAAADVGVALVGGRAGIAAQAATTLVRESGVRIVLAHHGYVAGADERDAALAALHASGAGLVVVGMGGGAQERFLSALRESGWHGLACSCGGYLDQLAAGDRVRYYPRWIDAWHLRAVWRVLHEPGRLLPRYLVGYLPFYRACAALLAGRARR